VRLQHPVLVTREIDRQALELFGLVRHGRSDFCKHTQLIGLKYKFRVSGPELILKIFADPGSLPMA
jgi:hypothetical protein